MYKQSNGNRKIKYDELLTLISQIEMIVNNRPLTYCYENEVALTPNNLIYGRRINRNDTNNNTEVNVEVAVGHIDKVLDHFWKN